MDVNENVEEIVEDWFDSPLAKHTTDMAKPIAKVELPDGRSAQVILRVQADEREWISTEEDLPELSF